MAIEDLARRAGFYDADAPLDLDGHVFEGRPFPIRTVVHSDQRMFYRWRNVGYTLTPPEVEVLVFDQPYETTSAAVYLLTTDDIQRAIQSKTPFPITRLKKTLTGAEIEELLDENIN